jgi:hypothetical protein
MSIRRQTLSSDGSVCSDTLTWKPYVSSEISVEMVSHCSSKLSPIRPYAYYLAVTRERITADHWTLIKDEKEALGYDREAYEHSLQLPKVFKGQSATIPTNGADGELMLLFRLGGLLDSPEKVKEIAGLDELPVVKEGRNEMGSVKFCVVDKEVQQKLEEWLAQKAVLQN